MLAQEQRKLVMRLADDLDQQIVAAGDEDDVGDFVAIEEVMRCLLRIGNL